MRVGKIADRGGHGGIHRWLEQRRCGGRIMRVTHGFQLPLYSAEVIDVQQQEGVGTTSTTSYGAVEVREDVGGNNESTFEVEDQTS